MSTAPCWCRLCQKEVETAGTTCPLHPSIELTEAPARTARPAAAEEEADAPRTVCWNCGTKSTRLSNESCANCHESLVPPALVIAFPAGRIVLRGRSESTELGRAGPHGQVFEAYPNVSRSHVTVGVDANGDAWLEPDPAAPNGTFVNGVEILARACIKPGDRIRLATDSGPHIGPTSEPVRFPRRESSPAPDP